MAYSELIKNFERIRDYMREFYVYGFRTRSEIAKKSTRSYDEERRHIEDYLGEYMGFRQGEDGKQFFLSVDTRIQKENPFYKAWKSCAFTDSDITLHFIIIDILKGTKEGLTHREIIEKMDNDYLKFFRNPMVFDESTLRKKLKEYVACGLIIEEKSGRKVTYSLGEIPDLSDYIDALSFFSEVEACGVIGSFIMDFAGMRNKELSFKHHYITQTMDSDVCLILLSAIYEKKRAAITKISRNGELKTFKCVPLEIWASVQNGRQYVMMWDERFGRLFSCRLDYIKKAEKAEECEKIQKYITVFENRKKYIWGVSMPGRRRLQSVCFSVYIGKNEEYIYDRLVRERRCGKVTRVSDDCARFEAIVTDADELLPWIRTFICRITEISFSEDKVKKRFLDDLDRMYDMYGIEMENRDDF